MAATTVTVRMYNVGFGDAFVVTVRRASRTWRMLVDCGVHSQGQARPIRDAVTAIIADLAAAARDGKPHLDVVVATHHHADHISGFALQEWQAVTVDEVWVPFVEDESDPDARALRQRHALAASRLQALLGARTRGLNPGAWPAAISAARSFAVNSFGNADATDRLLGRNGQHFASTPRIRYLPSTTPEENVIETGLAGVVAHILGPSRDPAELKLMEPPKSAGWLQLEAADRLAAPSEDGGLANLFNPVYAIDRADEGITARLRSTLASLRLDAIDNDEGLLAAASILERAVNNTSVFFVLDVAGTRLLFPGDAQQGAWDHVINDPDSRALITEVAFYKIGHHGSHNATPKPFVEGILGDGAYAMLPWGLVKRWKDTIPKTELLAALEARDTHVLRADAMLAEDNVTVHDDLWTEVSFSV